MIVYIDKNRYIENLEERLYSQLEERFYGKNVAAGVNKRVGNSYRPKQNPNPKPKNQGGIQNQSQNQNLSNQSQGMNQTQNMNIQNQGQNQNIQPQNQGSNPADTKPPIVSTEQTQKATEITSVANNSADAAKTPAVKKMEEQASKNSLSTEQMNKMQANAADISKNKAGGEGQQLSLFDQQTLDSTKKPTEPVKPAEPVKPVETPPAGGGAGDTSGGAVTDTAATTTTDTTNTNTTNTNTTNTNEEKKKGMGIGGKIALGAAGTIGIGAMGYAMGSGNNKDDDKRQ